MMNAQLVGLSREIALRRELDVIANNLANMNTTGYQADRVAFEDYLMPHAEASAFQNRDHDVAFVRDWATYRDTEPGARQMTGNKLDVAISAGGYLTVETPEGIRYTRDGSLRISEQGDLMTKAGYPVLAQGGARIQLDPGETDITITGNGEITTVGGARGALQLVAFTNEQDLEKVGGNLYAANEDIEPIEDADVRVTQGVLETSNVQTGAGDVPPRGSAARVRAASQHAAPIRPDAAGGHSSSRPP